MLSGKRLVDEKIFLIVSHGITEVNRFDAPTVPFKFVLNSPVEVLVVDGIVRAKRRCIVVENHGFILMRGVVAAEVLDECRYLTLELDVERFDYVEPSAPGLTGDNPVYVGVIVHAYADGRVGVNVLVGAGVERREVVIVTESIEVLIIVGVVFSQPLKRSIG